MTEYILNLQNLNCFYDLVHVLHDVNLKIKKGSIVGLIGKNGMGKTTLLNSIVGIKRPHQGSIFFKNKNITSIPIHSISNLGISYVPESRGIFPNLSVLENMIISKKNFNSKSWDLEDVLNLFPNLNKKLKLFGQELSGGEQQMLAIARALLANPELLILDEATEGLAPILSKKIWNVLRKICSTGMTIIIVDKNISSLLDLTDKLVIIYKGSIVFDDTSDLFSNDLKLKNKYLGV